MKLSTTLLMLLIVALFLSPKDNTQTQPFGVIDDSYEVNPSGAYNHIVPIHAPSGVKGLAPNLALVYDSRSGISEFGYGWALSGLSKIVRVGNNFAQHGKTTERSFTTKDAFLLDGQYMTCITGTNGKPSSVYRTENETFSVIRALEPVNTAEASPKFFVVKQQNGLTYYYGNSSDSRLEVNLSPSRKEVLEWNVSMVRDPYGNYIRFEYEQQNNTARIKSIQYTGNDKISLAPRNEITFNYEEDNAQKRIENQQYQSGIPTMDNNLIRNIAVGTNGRFFKYYHFSYDATKKYLREIKESTDEEGTKYIPVTTMSWNSSDSLSFGAPTLIKLPVSQDGSQTVFQDMDGDGQKEFIWFKNETRAGKDSIVVSIYKRSATGYETLAYSKAVDVGNTTNLLKNTRLLDADGDGDKDILGSRKILKNNSTPGKIAMEESPEFACAECFSAISALDANGRLTVLDLNGDAREEVILHGTDGKCSVYGFDKNGKFSALGSFNSVFYKSFTDDFSGIGKQELLFLNVESPTAIAANVLKMDNYTFSLKRIKIPAEVPVAEVANLRFQDINSDGISDLLLQKPNEKARIWINTGIGFTTESTLTPMAFGAGPNPRSTFGYFTSSENLQFLSVSSDTKLELWDISLNTANQLIFSPVDPKKIRLPKDIQSFTQFERLSFGDFDGDGRTDLSFMPAAKAEMALYPNANRYNNLMTGVTDGFGNLVTVNYGLLSDSSVYKTRLKSPVSPYTHYWGPYVLVRELRYSNGLGQDSMNRVNYRYEDLMLELRGRGLAGFRSFSKTEDNSGITIRTDYDYLFPFTGKILSETRTTAKGVIFFDQQNQWQLAQYRAGQPVPDASILKKLEQVSKFSESRISYLPLLKSSTVSKKDLDNVRVSKATITNAYNAFGQIIETATRLDDNTVAVTRRSFTNLDEDISEKGTYVLGLTATEISFAYKGADSSGKRRTDYEYDPSTGSLQRKTRQKDDPLYEQVSTFGYDETGNLTSKQMFAGTPEAISETFVYTADRRFIASHTDELGFSKQYTYDPRYSSIVQSRDINGLVSRSSYDDFGNLVQQVQPDGRTKTYSYSFLATVEDKFHGSNSNAVYKMTMQESGSPESVSYYDKLGREVSSRYYLLDSTLSQPGNDNPFGPLTAEQLTASSARRMVMKYREFDNRGNVSSEYKPQYIQLVNGRVLEMVAGKPVTKRVECVQFEDQEHYRTTYGYDVFNRLVSLTLPDGNVQRTEYSANTVVEYDLGKHRKTVLYNGRGQIEKVTNDQGNSIRYRYDLRGNLLEVTSPDGSSTETTYDLIGRKASTKDPNIGTVVYGYDRFDRLRSEVTNGTKEVKMEYDRAGRLKVKTTPEGVTTYRYDLGRKGSLDGITDASGNTYAYSYDNLGRLVSQTNELDHKKYTMALGYDSLSRLSSKTYPNGFKVSLSYQNNILVAIKNEAGKDLWRLGSVDAEGKILRKVLGNGLESRYSYNRYNGLVEQIVTDKSVPTIPPALLACNGNFVSNGLLIREYEKPSVFPVAPTPFNPATTFPKWASQKYGQKSNTVIPEHWKQQPFFPKENNLPGAIQNLTFTYNENYNLGSKVDGVNKVAEEYNYDNLNRLIRVIQTIKEVKTAESLSYDDSGNITSKSTEGVYQYDPEAKQRVTYITDKGKAKRQFHYDAYGNLEGDSISGLQLGYTSFNKPHTLTKDGKKKVISYGHDNQQNRTLLFGSEGELEVTTLRPFPEYEVTIEGKKETSVSSVFVGGEPILNEYRTKENNNTKVRSSYIHVDNLGSVNLLTNENGQKIAEFNYSAFGERKARKGDSGMIARGYTGHDQLDEFGLIDCKGRYYMPGIARFLSADPFVNSITDLQSLNRYSYVSNNPINTVDPSGYWGFNPFKAVANAVKSVVGAVSSAVSNVGRAVANAAEAYVGLYTKAFEEGERFVNKYGKQLIIIAAAVAITYVSGGTMAGLGMAMLQGAVIGAGIGAGITAIRGGSFSDILNAGFNGAITGASVAAMSYGLASGANAVFDGSAAAKHVLGGVNGYMSSGGGNQDEGFLRGVAASFIPADLGATSAFESSKTANFLLTVGSAAARGYVINGEEGMRMQVYGGIATMAAGHLAAIYASGGESYRKFEKGVYIYKSNSGSFSVGGAIGLEKGAWNPNTGDITKQSQGLLDHEIKHFTEQNTLGAMYLPVHAPRTFSESQFNAMETSPFHSNAAGGNY